MSSKVSIIIPTYNESNNIRNLVKEITNYARNIEIVIVDDNSPDRTGSIADELKSKNKNIKVVHRYDARGLGSAILEGFSHSTGEIVGVIDADFSHPPKYIPSLLSRFDEGYDLVVGSRYVKGGGIENWPKIRRLTSKVAIFISRPLTNIKDPVSGFFFVKRESIKNVKLSSRSWKVLLDIIVKGKFNKTTEVPFTFVNRQTGKSKIAFREYFNYTVHVMQLYMYKISHFIFCK